MASTKPLGSIGSVASSSAVTLYQGNHDSILCQHVEQKMLTLSEDLSSPPGCSEVRVLWSLVFWVVCWGGVIVCPSVVFPVVVVLSVLRFTAFNYPFGGIFKLFILYMQYFIWSHLHIDAFKPFTFLLLNYFEMFPNQQGVVIILRKFSQLPGKNDDITQNVMFFCNDQFILVNFVLNCQDCSSDWYKFSELVFKKKKN
jgi:hypothetical protein